MLCKCELGSLSSMQNLGASACACNPDSGEAEKGGTLGFAESYLS